MANKHVFFSAFGGPLHFDISFFYINKNYLIMRDSIISKKQISQIGNTFAILEFFSLSAVTSPILEQCEERQV